jgi:hypothetical protein
LEHKAAKGVFCAMNSWQLNRKVSSLTRELDDSSKSEIKIDINCLTEPIRKLFGRGQEIIDKYAPSAPPQDVIEKTADLWNNGLELFARRAGSKFVYVTPDSLCCDEIEEWYFKVYLCNFWLDWKARLKKARKMTKKQREELIAERREMGLSVFLFQFFHELGGEPENQGERKDSSTMKPAEITKQTEALSENLTRTLRRHSYILLFLHRPKRSATNRMD